MKLPSSVYQTKAIIVSKFNIISFLAQKYIVMQFTYHPAHFIIYIPVSYTHLTLPTICSV